MLAIVCPGQGAQTPGFLASWLEQPGVRELLLQYSESAGVDLIRHGVESDEETIRDTALAQPLLTAAALVSAHQLNLLEVDSSASAPLVAGHSVGEIPAAAIAGVLTEQQALQLIRVRGKAMAEAAAASPTSMAAVVGGVEEEVRAAIADAGLTAANVNAPGQIVAAGSADAISGLAENAPARARVIPLQVAGAFHTDYMASAQREVAKVSQEFEVGTPRTPLLSNRDGELVSQGDDVLQRIVDQVTRPVRWDLCMNSMAEQGVTGMLELLPGGTLTGLAKRGLKGVKTHAVKSPEDLDAAREFIEEHRG